MPSWTWAGNWSKRLRWLVLLGGSSLVAVTLECAGLPAALLLGPMLVAILLAVRGGVVGVSRIYMLAAQGVVGVMIANNLPLSTLAEVAKNWPIFLGGVLSTLLASSLLGWLLTRSNALPGNTAIWGSSPGAAMAMTLMSEDYGADMRLVAFMQYLRVLCCVLVASAVAWAIGVRGGPGQHYQWLPNGAMWPGAVYALALAVAGALAGIWLRVPGGPLLVPLVLGMAAKMVFSLSLQLPMALLAVCYGVIGWGIGMRFSPAVLVHAARLFLRVLLSILALVVVCGGFAAILVKLTHVDFLSAYLATSPGGLDSVAIIAASTKVDMPFVMAMQVARFILVLLVGPITARYLSGGAADS